MTKFVIPGKTKTVQGSITAPHNAGLRFIIDFVSQTGKYDSKLDSVLIKRFSTARTAFKEWWNGQQNFKLGALHTAAVASDTWLVYALVKDKEDKVDEKALATALKNLQTLAAYEHASVHVSTLLCEEYPALPDMLVKSVVEAGTNVYFYQEPVSK